MKLQTLVLLEAYNDIGEDMCQPCEQQHRLVFLGVFETLFFSVPERAENTRTPIPWFRMDGNGILGNTAAPANSRPCSGTRKFPLVRHVDSFVRSLHTICRGSMGFDNGNMFTNAFSLARFSCERVLGLFSVLLERGLEYAP
jgi:hypothetical protein